VRIVCQVTGRRRRKTQIQLLSVSARIRRRRRREALRFLSITKAEETAEKATAYHDFKAEARKIQRRRGAKICFPFSHKAQAQQNKAKENPNVSSSIRIECTISLGKINTAEAAPALSECFFVAWWITISLLDGRAASVSTVKKETAYGSEAEVPICKAIYPRNLASS
jgi:hypothetical protein